MRKQLIALTLACAPVLAHAAPDYKPTVYMNCSTEQGDNIGEQLCTAVKDAIASSPRYTLTVLEPSTKGNFYYKVHFVTLNGENGASFQSVVLTLDDPENSYYLTSWAFLTGGGKVREQATAIASKVDTSITVMIGAASK